MNMARTKSEFTNKLIRLVIPITLQQIMLALVSITDAVMLGVLNQDSLSAVSLAGQVTFVFNLFVYAIGAGFIRTTATGQSVKTPTARERLSSAMNTSTTSVLSSKTKRATSASLFQWSAFRPIKAMVRCSR